ncbi:sulfotransferase [Winogradskyella algicola]|uniref:sulfotransferase n=1 Tax=Winogradskyella algicola TaxID=2575815 RepID=UPI001109B48A|nr:sulfotransferase [Winogradskyella algicola]
MKKDFTFISGLGGSGTRVIVDIFKEINFNFGYDVNRADDDLSFTLLFKLPTHFKKYFGKRSRYINRLLDTHNKLLLNKRLNFLDCYFILRASILHFFQFRKYNFKWILYRYKGILFKRRGVDEQLWGWKEPHTIMFIEDIYYKYPKSKFILLIRNGLDMVYSKNNQQFYNYSEYFDIDNKNESEKNKFDFWYNFNKYSIEKGRKLFAENFHIVFYEDLIHHNEGSIKELLQFMGCTADQSSIEKIKLKITAPQTVNRFKNKDKSWIDKDVKTKLQTIGYDSKKFDLE